MKYTGLGFNLDLDSFEIVIEDKIHLREDNDNLKFNLFNIEGYKVGVASEYETTELIEIDIEELF